MLKVLVKILAVASLFAIIIIAKEFLEIYVVLKSIWIGFAYVFIALVCFVIIYFAIMPFWKIYRLSQIFNPETDIKRVDEEYKKRITILRKNKYLIEVGHHIPDNSNYKENYDAAIQKLENKSKEIREKYICNVFYSTALAQNGFLDAVLILSAGINLIQETFYLFNGRASNRDMWKVIRQIYFSIAIGGTEVTEFTVDELIKIGPKTMESVPFAGKIIILK
jgi:hypothetical protein